MCPSVDTLCNLFVEEKKHIHAFNSSVDGNTKVEKRKGTSSKASLSLDGPRPSVMCFRDIETALGQINLLARGRCILLKTTLQGSDRTRCRLGENEDVVCICKVADLRAVAGRFEEHLLSPEDQSIKRSGEIFCSNYKEGWGDGVPLPQSSC